MKRTLWFFLVPLVISALLLASCGTGSKTTAPTTGASPTSAPPTVATTAKAAVDNTPKYGGWYTIATPSTVVQLDEAYGPMSHTFAAYTHQELFMGDWAKGPAGTNEADWTYTGNNRFDLKVGAVAESLEAPEPGHMIFHIRKGIHFGLNRNLEASKLVNGRELIADDVVYTLKRLFSEPRAYLRNAYSNVGNGMVITAPDKNTVDIKVDVGAFADAYSVIPDMADIIAPELVAKYGNTLDWKACVGTGPFVVTDFVDGSQATFVRNNNFWMKDPVGAGKGNQLPYVDGVKLLFIPDTSTRQSAVRTAKLDQFGPFATLEDSKAVTDKAPQLQVKRYLEHASTSIGMRIYRDDLPFKDKNVRRALMMATDFEGMKKDMYGGDAEIFTWPFAPVREYADIFTPLNQMPDSIQELYKYNPDKAKQLLKDAGYPNGFKTKILCNSQDAAAMDKLESVKAMWAKVNVNLELDNREAGVFTSIWQGMKYDEMIHSGGASVAAYFRCISYDTASYWNLSQVSDSYVKQEKAKIYDAFNTLDWKKINSIHRDLLNYVLDQAWNIPMPLSYSYVVSWPWVKNYHGELAVAWAGGPNASGFIWIDQGLREDMIGRR